MDAPRDLFRSRRKYRIERMRYGQQGSMLTILELVSAGQRFISVVLPTRYGKSDVIRMSAFELHDLELIGAAMVLSPNNFLRNQVVIPEKIQEMLERYDATFGNVSYGLTLAPVANPNVNGERLLSATIQVVQRNLDIFGQWVNSVYHRTGKRAAIYIDEAHTGSQSNEWGKVARVLSEYGAIIILLTATPYRADGDTIFGFQTEVLEEKDVRKYVTKDGSHPDLYMVEVYDGSQRLVRLKADYEYTLREAWEEDPLAVAKIDWLPFAVDLNEFKTGLGLAQNGTTILSQLPPSTVRKILGRIGRDPKVIERGVDVLVRKLRELKQRESRISGIVFCGNDKEDDPDFNMHARLVQDMVKIMAPEFRVLIATSSMDEGADNIEAFRAGTGDILIVKQMASVGLDSERLKVALDLSPVRTAAGFLQRLMRIATVFRNFVGIYIGPDEPIGKALFERFVVAEGGQATIADLELVNCYEKPREPKPKTTYTVNGTDFADFGDSDQNWADKDLIHKVDAFRRMVPEVIGVVSHAALAARIETFGWDFKSDTANCESATNTHLTIFTLRKSIVGKVLYLTKIDRVRRGLTKDSREETFGDTCKAIWKKTYQVAEVPFTPIEKQNDISILMKLDRAADYITAYYNPKEDEGA
jgi:superfamily II DNA or RNA helicase